MSKRLAVMLFILILVDGVSIFLTSGIQPTVKDFFLLHPNVHGVVAVLVSLILALILCIAVFKIVIPFFDKTRQIR